MTVTAYLVWFIFMAIATMTILVVGTLGAADLLHRPRRSDQADRRSDGSQSEHHPESVGVRQDSQRDAAAGRNADLVDALMPLGSSLSFVAQLKPPPAAEAGRDHEDAYDEDSHDEDPRHEDSQHGQAA
jgi:hypothetical protein